MATYIPTVIAHSPLFFNVDQTLAGSEYTDLSGNDYHGEYYPEAVRGMFSPIETEALVRAVGNRVAFTPAPPTLDNFTWVAWIYAHAGQPAIGLCRTGQIGVSNSNILYVDAGTAVARLNHAGGASSPHDLTYAVPQQERFYRLSIARNSTVLTFRVNGAVVDLRSDFPSGPVTNPAVIAATDWKVGVNVDANLYAGYATDGIEIYDYPLTDEEDREIYESALNSLSLFGVSNVIPSAVLYSDVEPDPIHFPFRHNWSDPLIERISFKTGVSRAVKGYEQGNQQRIKPRREIEISQMLRDDREREAFRAKLTANQGRKWFIPMLEDRERLTTPISSGVSVIPTDTLYKNYEVGGYVELRQLNDAGRITANEHLLITGLEDDEVQTATATINSYTNPEVMPACRGIVSESQSLRGHTDSVEDTTITARLVAEDEKVVPRRIVPWTPGTTYKSYEVYPNSTWPNDWTELRDYSTELVRKEVDFDLGSFTVDSDALAANETFSWRILIEGKQQQAEFLGWFYAHAGSWNYLWVPSMQHNFIPVNSVGSNLTVESHNYFDNFAGSEFRKDLVFTYHDNSIAPARINSVALSGANEVLTLSTMPTLTNLRSVSYLKFCRLESDTLEIAKVTDTKARFAWRFQEILSSPA